MFKIKSVISPTLIEALTLVVAIILMISVSIVKFDAVPHLPILFAILLLICYGLVKKFRTVGLKVV